MTIPGAVYVQTNDADRNEVLVFGRNADGSLDSIGAYDTRGRGSGSGSPHLPSQGSVVLSADGRLTAIEAVEVSTATAAGLAVS